LAAALLAGMYLVRDLAVTGQPLRAELGCFQPHVQGRRVRRTLVLTTLRIGENRPEGRCVISKDRAI